MNSEQFVGALCLIGAGILGTWVVLAVVGMVIQLLPVFGVIVAAYVFWRALRWVWRH